MVKFSNQQIQKQNDYFLFRFYSTVFEKPLSIKFFNFQEETFDGGRGLPPVPDRRRRCRHLDVGHLEARFIRRHRKGRVQRPDLVEETQGHHRRAEELRFDHRCFARTGKQSQKAMLFSCLFIHVFTLTVEMFSS
jgi:hypothetical protein